jgi:hypothetical protein
VYRRSVLPVDVGGASSSRLRSAATELFERFGEVEITGEFAGTDSHAFF